VDNLTATQLLQGIAVALLSYGSVLVLYLTFFVEVLLAAAVMSGTCARAAWRVLLPYPPIRSREEREESERERGSTMSAAVPCDPRNTSRVSERQLGHRAYV
jgi:hypothetical protein